jgi:hypothetical protein
MRDIIETILSGAAFAVLVAGILSWTMIFQALSQ